MRSFFQLAIMAVAMLAASDPPAAFSQDPPDGQGTEPQPLLYVTCELIRTSSPQLYAQLVASGDCREATAAAGSYVLPVGEECEPGMPGCRGTIDTGPGTSLHVADGVLVSASGIIVSAEDWSKIKSRAGAVDADALNRFYGALYADRATVLRAEPGTAPLGSGLSLEQLQILTGP